MKSHDCHVLLQRLLPIGMRGFVSKEICTTLFELGNFFQELCSKTLRQSDTEKWEERVVLILCKLERIFPPAFFDVMVHLAVHFPCEAMIAGPVQYRWMYSIERSLGKLKKYVTNKARPEGSNVEAYIVQECLTFCSMYMRDRRNKPERNRDVSDHGFKMEIFNQHVHLFSPNKGAPDPSKREREIAHWFVLYNCPKAEPYLEYVSFYFYMNDLRTQGSEEATEELWSLANGPGSIIDLYSGCISNGVRFHTRDRENRRMCQNSGIVMEGEYRKKNFNFYGYLSEIWELRYAHGGRVALFQCEWYNTGHKSRIYTDEHVTSIDITRIWCKDDPLVLPRNVRQVFYINDTSKGKNWRVVEPIRHRGVWDVPEQDDSPRDPFQQDETVDGGVPIQVEDFEVQQNRDNVNHESIPNDDFMVVHVDDQDNEDDTMVEYMDDEDDDLRRQSDLDDSDVDLDMDYDI
ncbi:hypothetical protein Vadar_006705 [Vaccinium darrowii]|uniref:Uncharacterized protein n=1 Tax=Vaccinium darrowii TaxID=229202 RepID=A0ACB7XYQ7_9ERIC|nr:hypothetical protein Vadar_006705 [Vaccinium darrowii]